MNKKQKKTLFFGTYLLKHKLDVCFQGIKVPKLSWNSYNKVLL